MATNSWFESLPSGTSEVRQLDTEIQETKLSVRSGLDDEHFWDSADGSANRGTHRLGAARAYLDAQSNLSQSGTSYIGRLYVASDTSRLFAVPDSGQTLYLGGSLVPEVSSVATGATPVEHYPGQNARWSQQFGTIYTAGTSVITFEPPYVNPPFVLASAQSTGAAPGLFVRVDGSASTRTAQLHIVRHDNVNTQADVFWMSAGTINF